VLNADDEFGKRRAGLAKNRVRLGWESRRATFSTKKIQLIFDG